MIDGVYCGVGVSVTVGGAVCVGDVVSVGVGELVDVAVGIPVEVAVGIGVLAGVGSGAASTSPPREYPMIPPRSNRPATESAMSPRDMTRIYASDGIRANRILG